MARLWAGVLAVVAFCQVAEAAPLACRVVRVVDGDTLQMACQGAAHRVRLLGYDTAEVTRPACEAERVAGLAAAEVLRDLVALGAVTGFAVAGRDRYGRDLADVAIAGRDVAAAMLGSGLALPYWGGQRPDWCGVLADG